MGPFGSSTCKPMQMWSTRNLDALRRDKPANSGEGGLASGGCSGVQAALQESEILPELFGLQVF